MVALDALRDKRIIYIGGVSGSGKSVLASALVAALPQFNLVKLDWIYNGLHASRRHGGVKRSRRVMARLAPAIVAEVVADAAADDRRFIIEGGWVEPKVWQRLAGSDPAAYALFLGYPDAGVAAMIERLTSTAHWLRGGTASDRRFLADQVRHSKRLRRQLAGRAGAEFIDVSADFTGLPTGFDPPPTL